MNGRTTEKCKVVGTFLVPETECMQKWLDCATHICARVDKRLDPAELLQDVLASCGRYFALHSERFLVLMEDGKVGAFISTSLFRAAWKKRTALLKEQSQLRELAVDLYEEAAPARVDIEEGELARLIEAMGVLLSHGGKRALRVLQMPGNAEHIRKVLGVSRKTMRRWIFDYIQELRAAFESIAGDTYGTGGWDGFMRGLAELREKSLV